MRWAICLLSLLGGALAGWAVERAVLGRLREAARRTRSELDDLLVSSLRGLLFGGLLLLGVALGLPLCPLSAPLRQTAGRALLALALALATLAAMRVAGGLVALHTRRDLPRATTIFSTLVRLLVLALGGLVILQTLGIAVSPLLATFGIGGLAVALALQDTLANLFAGVHVLMAKQVKPGDYVRLDSGEEGYVVDVSWRNTTVRMLPNNLVIIPNAKLASAVITNYNLPEPELAVLVQVGVSYASDLEHVERVTVEVAREVMREVPGGVPEFEPFIRYHTFGDFSINFTVILRAKTFVDQYLVRHEFVKRLHRRYAQEGIEIPFPIRTVYMRGEARQGG